MKSEGGLVAVKYVKLRISSNILKGAGDAERNGTQWDNQRFTTILREVQILSQLQKHPNVLSLIGYGLQFMEGDMTPFLVSEYAKHHSMDDFLLKYHDDLSIATLFGLCTDVAQGLAALHDNGIVHGDVKAANVLIFDDGTSPQTFTAKLSDLGFAMIPATESSSTSYRGTTLFNAPEVQRQLLKYLEPDSLFACDVYSYGILAWLVVSKMAAMKDLEGKTPEDMLRDAIRCAESLGTSAQSQKLCLIFKTSLDADPTARPRMHDICLILAQDRHR